MMNGEVEQVLGQEKRPAMRGILGTIEPVVTETGVPPLTLTRIRGVCVPAENTITPPGPQAPPRPNGASAITCAEPPFKSTVFNFPSAKNPSERLSGDQKGKIAFSVPGTTRTTSESMGRTQIEVLPSALVAVNATLAPSGDSTGGPADHQNQIERRVLRWIHDRSRDLC